MLEKRVDSLDENIKSMVCTDVMELEKQSLSEISKEMFWKDIFGDKASTKAPVFVEIMKDLINTVERKNPFKTSWGIEIPLPYSDRIYEHVTFWVSLAESVLSERGWQPQFIWGDIKNNNKQSLYLFFRPITPIFLSHLLGSRVDNGVLIHLEEESKREIKISLAAEQIGSIDANESLVDAINDWSDWSHKK
jgi:hypothetical protein